MRIKRSLYLTSGSPNPAENNLVFEAQKVKKRKKKISDLKRQKIHDDIKLDFEILHVWVEIAANVGMEKCFLFFFNLLETFIGIIMINIHQEFRVFSKSHQQYYKSNYL